MVAGKLVRDRVRSLLMVTTKEDVYDKTTVISHECSSRKTSLDSMTSLTSADLAKLSLRSVPAVAVCTMASLVTSISQVPLSYISHRLQNLGRGPDV